MEMVKAKACVTAWDSALQLTPLMVRVREVVSHKIPKTNSPRFRSLTNGHDLPAGMISTSEARIESS